MKGGDLKSKAFELAMKNPELLSRFGSQALAVAQKNPKLIQGLTQKAQSFLQNENMKQSMFNSVAASRFASNPFVKAGLEIYEEKKQGRQGTSPNSLRNLESRVTQIERMIGLQGGKRHTYKQKRKQQKTRKH